MAKNAMPTNLDELLEVVLAGALTEQEITRLPTFGGEEPRSTSSVWSWDEKRLLVSDVHGTYKIVSREDWR